MNLAKLFLDYEVAASWWASWISNPRLQALAARWFALKVNRKMRRYLASKAIQEQIQQCKQTQKNSP